MDDPNDALLQPGTSATSVPFVVWDGSRGDRDGQKSVSARLALSLPSPEIGFAEMWPFLAMLGLAAGRPAALRRGRVGPHTVAGIARLTLARGTAAPVIAGDRTVVRDATTRLATWLLVALAVDLLVTRLLVRLAIFVPKQDPLDDGQRLARTPRGDGRRPGAHPRPGAPRGPAAAGVACR